MTIVGFGEHIFTQSSGFVTAIYMALQEKYFCSFVQVTPNPTPTLTLTLTLTLTPTLTLTTNPNPPAPSCSACSTSR